MSTKCRLSAEGRRYLRPKPQHEYREGVIVRDGKVYSVIWNGLKSAVLWRKRHKGPRATLLREWLGATLSASLNAMMIVVAGATSYNPDAVLQFKRESGNVAEAENIRIDQISENERTGIVYRMGFHFNALALWNHSQDRNLDGINWRIERNGESSPLQGNFMQYCRGSANVFDTVLSTKSTIIAERIIDTWKRINDLKDWPLQIKKSFFSGYSRAFGNSDRRFHIISLPFGVFFNQFELPLTGIPQSICSQPQTDSGNRENNREKSNYTFPIAVNIFTDASSKYPNKIIDIGDTFLKGLLWAIGGFIMYAITKRRRR
jgi:hypothetical protein